jgi:hypothetical protein
MRSVYPLPTTTHEHRSNEPDTTALATITADQPPAEPDAPMSDWLPLGTLVRLPTLLGLQCPTDTALPCTLNGTNLFLVESISTDPAFTSPISVPDGYTGSSLTLPHPTASTIFLHLRDDPAPVDPAIVPTMLPAPSTLSSHTHSASHGEGHGEIKTPKGPAE